MAADNTAMNTQLLVDALARDPQLEMIEGPSSLASLQLAKREKPQIVVIGAALDESSGSGFALAREIRAQLPATKIILLLDSAERTSVVEAFRAGAHGVFCRTEPVRMLIKCIQCVHQGQVWAGSAELRYLIEALTRPALADFRSESGARLTARELDVVRLLAEGLTNREIARRLKLTEHTIKNYLFRIFDKLGVSSRVEVVLRALGESSRAASGSVPRRPAQRAAMRRPTAANLGNEG